MAFQTLVVARPGRFTGGMTAPAGIDWEWTVRSHGRLSNRQKLQLVPPLVRGVLAYPSARLRLATGRCGSARLDLDALDWPDSKLAREATVEAREVLTSHVLEHSFRTYLFGLLLAQLSEVTVDRELAFVSCMLHDTQLEHPTPGRCFAVAGGERAERFALDHGADPELAAQIGAAIAGHITPGAAADLSDPAGFVSAGALADITGVGLQDIDPAWVDEVHARHPRHDLRRHLLGAWRNEGRAMPAGRARWLTRYGAFPMLLRAAPFDQ